MNQQNRLLTPSELAARWSVTVRTLRRWREQGTGPAWIRLGDSPKSPVRYSLDEVIRHEQAR